MPWVKKIQVFLSEQEELKKRLSCQFVDFHPDSDEARPGQQVRQ